jgi:hypothetical protein
MLTNAEALKRVIEFLDHHQIPYMLIGGLANAMWGQVRVTRDVDFKVSIGDRSIAEFRQLITQQFPERPTAVPPHLQPPHIVHVWAAPGVAVDFFISVFEYEQAAIARAAETVLEDVRIRVCMAEDLVIHKVIANREQDWIDIEGILIRQRRSLDQPYILNWLRQFADALETPEIVSRYERLKTKYETA